MIAKRMTLLCLCLGAAFARAQSLSAEYSGRLVQGEWKKAWSVALSSSLSGSGLYNHKEQQIESLCPGYNSKAFKRQIFWQQLMISLSWKESLHGPENYVHFNHGVNDGLFQINPQLRTAYGCGNIDLFNALSNIQCAVRMAAHLVDQFGTFLSGRAGGMAAYWQPLRGDAGQNARNRSFILTSVKEACKTGRIDYQSTKQPEFNEAGEPPEISFNTVDALGLRPEELEPLTWDEESPRIPPTFRYFAPIN